MFLTGLSHLLMATNIGTNATQRGAQQRIKYIHLNTHILNYMQDKWKSHDSLETTYSVARKSVFKKKLTDN